MAMARRMALLALVMTTTICSVLVWQGRWRWASGLAVAAIWSVINFSMIGVVNIWPKQN